MFVAKICTVLCSVSEFWPDCLEREDTAGRPRQSSRRRHERLVRRPWLRLCPRRGEHLAPGVTESVCSANRRGVGSVVELPDTRAYVAGPVGLGSTVAAPAATGEIATAVTEGGAGVAGRVCESSETLPRSRAIAMLCIRNLARYTSEVCHAAFHNTRLRLDKKRLCCPVPPLHSHAGPAHCGELHGGRASLLSVADSATAESATRQNPTDVFSKSARWRGNRTSNFTMRGGDGNRSDAGHYRA